MENNWSEFELNLYGLVAGKEGGVLLANIYSEACSLLFYCCGAKGHLLEVLNVYRTEKV